MEEKNVVVSEAVQAPISEEKSDMKKKILILVFLLLCVGALITLVVFRSGIPIVDFWTVTGTIKPVDTEVAHVKEIAENIGVRTGGEGTLALYEKQDEAGRKTLTVLHLARGKILAEIAETDTVSYEVVLCNSGGAAWYSVTAIARSGSEVRYSLSLCDDKGEIFAQKKDMTLAVYNSLQYAAVLDLVRFEREVFRVDADGTVRSAFHLDTFAGLPNFQQKMDDYYFVFGDKCCYIYDENAVLTAMYHIPSAGLDPKLFVLSDGTLFAQYVTFGGEHMDDYTYAENGQKYKLHQVLISADDGAQTPLDDPEFYFESILSDADEIRRRGLNTSIENLAQGYYIKDYLLDTSTHCLSAVLFSDRGKITSAVENIIPAMYGGEIYGVAKNRWVAKNLAGECFLLNEWGSIVGSFPNRDSSDLTIAKSLFICDNQIYDWDLNLLYDMEENAVLSHMLVGSSVVMYKENGETLLFDPVKKEATELLAAGADKSVSVLGSTLIAIEQMVDGDKQYEIYNEKNVYLVTLTAQALFVQSHDVDGKRIVEILASSADAYALYLATVEEIK